MCVNLVLLTDGTTIDEMFYKGGETWPLVVAFKENLGAEDPHVASGRRGVESVEERRSGQWRNVHATFEIKMSVVKGPVSYGGT